MAIAKKSAKQNVDSKSKKSTKVKLVKNDASDSERYKMICEAAYFRAEQRDFQGDDMQHWLEAEQEIDNHLNI